MSGVWGVPQWLYVVLTAGLVGVLVLVAVRGRTFLRSHEDPSGQQVYSPEELGFAVGGTGRAVLTMLARLHAEGFLRLDGDRVLPVPGASRSDEHFEYILLQALASGPSSAREVRDRLERANYEFFMAWRLAGKGVLPDGAVRASDPLLRSAFHLLSVLALVHAVAMFGAHRLGWWIAAEVPCVLAVWAADVWVRYVVPVPGRRSADDLRLQLLCVSRNGPCDEGWTPGRGVPSVLADAVAVFGVDALPPQDPLREALLAGGVDDRGTPRRWRYDDLAPALGRG
ncbi:MAG TPA: TIGR04222 domain-containing membrane protein [Kineosporiaceae bacterium]